MIGEARKSPNATWRAQSAKAPWPGSTIRSARATSSGSAVTELVRPVTLRVAASKVATSTVTNGAGIGISASYSLISW